MVTYLGPVDDGAEVFRALADPTRRRLLDALFTTDGQTVVALCTLFPEMSRFGVMKHLKVLEEANLVSTRRVGRTKLHFLNPVPIAQIAHRWIDKYAAPYASALVELERQVREAPPPPEDPPPREN
jgi:DNA-binding transcriptional ArsR family regulator